MAITLDFESNNPGSNPGTAYFLFFFWSSPMTKNLSASLRHPLLKLQPPSYPSQALRYKQPHLYSPT